MVVSFDMPTDRAKGDPFGAKAFVDDLLVFSQPIGDDYSGEWIEDDSRLRISILTAPTTRSTLPDVARACSLAPPGSLGLGVGLGLGFGDPEPKPHRYPNPNPNPKPNP